MANNRFLDHVRSAISQDLRTALKARDPAAVSGLRAALNALDHATAIVSTATVPLSAGDVPRREVAGAEIASLLHTALEEHGAAAIEYQRLGHPDRAARLREEAQAIRRCLDHLPGVGVTP